MRRQAAYLATIATIATLVPTAAFAADESTIQLAFYRPLGSPVTVAMQAQKLAADVNAARAERGLPTLVVDPRLNKIALDVAAQMASQHYFGHTDPNGVTFEQRLRASG